MRLERRILLLIIMSVLLPGLLVNYSRLVLDTRAKLRVEEQRGISFTRYVVTMTGPQRAHSIWGTSRASAWNMGC